MSKADEEKWYINAFIAHCIFTILYQLKEECGEDEEGSIFGIWYASFAPFETSRNKSSYRGLRVIPVESDKVFFKKIITTEIERLAALPTNKTLYCGHAVHQHRDELELWLKKYF